MSKRVPLTPKLQETIRSAIGDPELDASKFAIFEARMVSSEPLTKGGIFNKARISASTIKEMETFLNQPGAAIPLHIMHDDRVLPVGRVFSAKAMNMPNGEVELRGQFLVPLDKSEIVADIENSIVDEVSVGLVTKGILCSECGFDYRGEDATIMNFIDAECGNGHKIGLDGVHTRLVGLDDFMELSLVGQGAANNPKILPRVKQSMSKEMVERLAASKIPAEACVLTASYKMEDSSKTFTETNEGESDMDIKEILAQLTASTSELAEKKVELSQTTAKVEALNGEIVTLTASNKELTDKVTALEAAKGDSTKDLEAKLLEVETQLKAATDMVAPHVKAALVASGVAEKDLPQDLLGQIKLVEEKGLKLHQVIGSGPVASGTKSDDPALNAGVDHRKEAFKLSGNK